MKKVVALFLSVAGGICIGAGIASRVMGKAVSKADDMSGKHLSLFLMMNQWVRVKQKGKNLSEYFKENGFKRIAVYGMSYAGKTFLDELDGTGIEVLYGIDKNADSISLNINIVTMEDNLEEPDAVVVTAITFYEEIKEELSKKLKCPVLSLEDILYEV